MGLAHIHATFARTKAEGRPALIPYWPLGFPDPDTSLRVIQAIARAGADMVEIGIPFSDPLADGAVIQRATHIALEHGITVKRCIDIATQVRRNGVTVPLLAMGYLNPIIAYGESKYVIAWQRAQVDGLIVPDLPPEESTELRRYCAQNDMALVQFTAPNSTEQRIDLAATCATGFIYVVAVTGVTGARNHLASGLREYVERVRARSHGKPVVLGFGISKPEHVREVGQYTDGVIVASALIKAAEDAVDPARVAYEFVWKLRTGMGS